MPTTSRHLLLPIMWLGFTGLCAAVLSLAGVYLYLDPQVPRAETYRHIKLETPLRVYTQDEKLVAEFGERRLIPIGLSEVPNQFVKALLDTEDKRFYSHSGIDFISLVNDTIELILGGGEIRSGASTITMQLARNVSFNLEQTFIRKFKEMLLALKIEQELSKDEILELYINVVPFGKRAYGAQAAALTYYGKPLNELDLPQLAMLAGIPQAPTAGNPVNGPDRAVRRRNLVLDRMLEQGSITAAEHSRAIAAPVTARLYRRELDVPAPYPSEWVRQLLKPRFDDLYSGGYEVFTTLDATMQTAATAALRKGLITYDRRHGYRGPERQVARNDQPEEAAGEDVASAAGEDVASAAGEDVAGSGDKNAHASAWIDALSATTSVADLEPAIVTGVDDAARTADILLGPGRTGTVPWTGISWARRYIDSDARGPRPRKPSDVLAPGDLIRVQWHIPPPPEDDAAPPEFPHWRLAQLPEIQGAVVAIDPDNGAIRAMRGGFDFGLNQYNHALQAARQPGSGFKPFVYSAALEHGVTPASIFLDAPLVFDDTNLETQYRPDNDNNRYNGPTRLREALYRSINLVSMRVLLAIQAGNVLEHVTRFGFDTRQFPRNTQLAIGGGTMAITPLQMVSAYAVFSNGGYAVEPHILSRVVDRDGNVLFDANYPRVCPDCGTAPAAAGDEPVNLADVVNQAARPIPAPRVIDERNAYIMTSMLRDVIRRGTGRRARVLNRGDLAGKTGTTDEAADTWFNGFNRDLVATVWVGFDDHRALGAREYGSNTPLPIWIDFMDIALAGKPERQLTQPAGIVTMKVNPATGKPAEPNEQDAIFEYFFAEYAPSADASPYETSPQAAEINPVDLF